MRESLNRSIEKQFLKYQSEGYIEVDAYINVVDFEFYIVSIELDLKNASIDILSHQLKPKFKIPSNFKYKQNLNCF